MSDKNEIISKVKWGFLVGVILSIVAFIIAYICFAWGYAWDWAIEFSEWYVLRIIRFFVVLLLLIPSLFIIPSEYGLEIFTDSIYPIVIGFILGFFIGYKLEHNKN